LAASDQVPSPEIKIDLIMEVEHNVVRRWTSGSLKTSYGDYKSKFGTFGPGRKA
jgi:hypothetical protein